MPTWYTKAQADLLTTAAKARATHTGTQTSATISDFTEAVQDAVAALLGAGSNVVLNYDDAANTLTIGAVAGGTGLDVEAVRDAIGVALVGIGNIGVVVNDAADTITVTTTATTNSTDAQLRDRSTHTGTQPATTVSGLAAVATSGAKSDVGLGNVDNTSDASKPISTAAAAALAAKADLVGGVIPSSQIPALATHESVTVASQAAMLALTGSQVQKGDLAIRTDGAGTFILTAADPSQLANWTRLNAPTDVVTSVNGQQGLVVLGKGDIGLGNVDNTSDAVKPVSIAQAAADATKLDLLAAPSTLTSSGPMTVGAWNLLDATTGPLIATLPAPTKIGQRLIAERQDAGTNLISFAGTVRGVTTGLPTLPGLGVRGESIDFEAESLTSWRIIASHKPKALLDQQFASLSALSTLIAYVDNGDGTATVTGPGITDNGDGTITFTSSAGSLLYKKSQLDTLLGTKLPKAGSGDAVGSVPTKQADGSTAYAVPVGGTASNVQIFTANGTWTKPAGVTSVYAAVISGGGGGGSGRRGPSGTAISGGSGGGGGAYSFATFPASSLPATVPVVVGAGGAGGVAQTTDATNGNPGSPGGNSSFGSRLRAITNGSGQGLGGTTANVAGGGIAQGMMLGSAGAGATVGAAGSTAGSSFTGGGGGGSGAGISAAPAAFTGGNGGYSLYLDSIAAGGASGGGAGNSPTSADSGSPTPASGGSGGGSSTTSAGGAGGAGGNYGGGGGGGAAALNGNNSGAGGKGGDGIVLVIAW